MQLEMLAWARLRLGGGVENPRKLPLIRKSATNPTTSNDARKESANKKRPKLPRLQALRQTVSLNDIDEVFAKSKKPPKLPIRTHLIKTIPPNDIDEEDETAFECYYAQ